VISALLSVRLRSIGHRLKSAGWLAIVQGLLVAGAVLAGAAYQGDALTRELFARAGGVAPAWTVLREWIYLGVAVQCLIVGYGAMEALLRPPDGALLLTLPIGPGARYAVATVDVAAKYLPVPLVLTAFFAPLAAMNAEGASLALVRALALIGITYPLAIATGLGISALAGRMAASPHGHALKELLANQWVAADRAPYLYAPAVGGGIAAFLAVPLQVSFDEWPADTTALAVGLGFVLGVGVVLFALGAVAYARGFARLAPALENLDARYPLSPHAGSETKGVYGAALTARLPGLMGAVAERDMLAVRRRHRAEPLLLFVLGAAAALVLDRSGAGARGWGLAAVGLACFAARTGVQLGSGDVEVGWLTRALPIPLGALLGAKFSIALFHALHAAIPFAAFAAWAGAPWAALAGVVTAIVAAAFGPALGLACAGRAGLARGLYLPLAAGACFAALAHPLFAPAGLAVLAGLLLVRARVALAGGAA
jgi:hypothetical protein